MCQTIQALAFHTAHGLPSLGPTNSFSSCLAPLILLSVLNHLLTTIHTHIHLCMINSMNTINVLMCGWTHSSIFFLLIFPLPSNLSSFLFKDITNSKCTIYTASLTSPKRILLRTSCFYFLSHKASPFLLAFPKVYSSLIYFPSKK